MEIDSKKDNKGSFGTLLEKYYFESFQTKPEADFSQANLELKTAGLKLDKNGRYKNINFKNYATGGYGYMALTICDDIVVVAVQYTIKWYKIENGSWTEKGTIPTGPTELIKCKLKKSRKFEIL